MSDIEALRLAANNDEECTSRLISRLPNSARGNEALAFVQKARRGEISRSVAWVALSTAWEHDYHEVERAFRDAGIRVEAGFELAARPFRQNETIKTFRGVWHHAPTAELANGLSWTLSVQTAAYFACMYRRPKDTTPLIFEAEVPSRFVLARLDGRHENEVILNRHAFGQDRVTWKVEGRATRLSLSDFIKRRSIVPTIEEITRWEALAELESERIRELNR